MTPQTTTTQTRTFNYTSGTTVGADLLSATNPVNGTVTYTYNADHTLNTKTDAKGQVFTYTYDGYKRLLTVSVAGTTLRTYSYDTNPYDGTYSQNSAGRLTAIQYPAINYDVYVGIPQGQGSTTFTDMFSYWQPGNVAGKRLRVTKVNPYISSGQQHTQTAVGDLNMVYAYNYEGKLTSVTYPTDAYGTTPQFTYSYDNMMRPVGMTDQNSASIVSNVQYGLSNELLQMTYIGGATEIRTYNSMLQLTNITGLGQNITYTFSAAGQNAGKITSQTDNISGETVSYLYDSLNRLTSAGAALGDPGSWNRYAYVAGDPANRYDSSGLYYCVPSDDDSPRNVPAGCSVAYGILSGGFSPGLISGGGGGAVPLDPAWLLLLSVFAYGGGGGGGGGGGATPPTITTKCQVQLFEQSIPNVPGGYHTYLEVTFQVSVNGILTSSFDSTLEGVNAPKSNPQSSDWTPLCLLNQCWLNKRYNTNYGVVGTSASSTYPFEPTLIWNNGHSSPNEGDCVLASKVLGLFAGYRQNSITYNNAFASHSNSFTFSLLYWAGVPYSDLMSIPLNPNPLPGWGFPIPIGFFIP